MERIGNKVSYIKKPYARRGFVSVGLAAVSAGFLAGAVGLSYMAQGNAPQTAAALGFCSIITACSGLGYGILSFWEPEKNYLFGKIGLAVSGVFLLFWLIVIMIAL